MAGGRLSTHVLDTSRGKPAAGVNIALYRVAGNSHSKIKEVVTNHDGRTDQPMLVGDDLEAGVYELVFFAGDYFDAIGMELAEPKFVDQIPLRFGMSEASHYHVPLLLSPFSFSTYRGS